MSAPRCSPPRQAESGRGHAHAGKLGPKFIANKSLEKRADDLAFRDAGDEVRIEGLGVVAVSDQQDLVAIGPINLCFLLAGREKEEGKQQAGGRTKHDGRSVAWRGRV